MTEHDADLLDAYLQGIIDNGEKDDSNLYAGDLKRAYKLGHMDAMELNIYDGTSTPEEDILERIKNIV